MRFLAVDPGGTTGIAEWEHHDFRSRQISDPNEAVAYVERWLEEDDSGEDGARLIVEDFRPRPGVRTWQPDALHIIGALRYVCWQRDERIMSLVQPANKTFATDARLRKAGFYVPGEGHANDAARHLLKALVRAKLVNLEDLL